MLSKLKRMEDDSSEHGESSKPRMVPKNQRFIEKPSKIDKKDLINMAAMFGTSEKEDEGADLKLKLKGRNVFEPLVGQYQKFYPFPEFKVWFYVKSCWFYCPLLDENFRNKKWIGRYGVHPASYDEQQDMSTRQQAAYFIQYWGMKLQL